MRTNYYYELWEKDRWPLPVVPMSEGLNPFFADGVHMNLVLGCELPYQSMKSYAVLALLFDAECSGELKPGETDLIMASSGAAGLALAEFGLSKPFSARSVRIVMNTDAPLGKSMPPYFAGATIVHPDQGATAIETAERMAQEDGLLHLNQYERCANFAFYRNLAAHDIWKQYPEITMLVSPLGTGGTVIGLEQGLRQFGAENLTVVTAGCASKIEIPGIRDPKGLEAVKLPWQESVLEENRMWVERDPSYLAAAWFHWEQSIMAGLSGGAAYVAALMNLKKRKDAGTLDELRGSDDKIHVCVVIHDGARPYLVDRFPMLHHDYQSPLTAPKPWELLWAA